MAFLVSCGFIVGAIEALRRANARAATAIAEIDRQREWLATSLASIGDAVIATDEKGRVSFLNSEAERLTGWKMAEATGRLLPEIFHIVNESTRAVVENPVEKVLRSGAVVGLANHTILVARDGAETPIDDSAAPIRHGDGPVFGVVLVFRDITERKQAERALRESETVLRTVTNEAQVGLVLVDQERRYRFANQAYAEILGLPSAAIVGQRVPDVLAHVYEQIRPRLDRAFAGERVAYELKSPRHPKIGGEGFYDVVYEPRVKDVPEPYVVVVVVDITERKQAEETLRASEERHRALVSILTDVPWRTDAAGELFPNEAQAKFTGQTLEQLKGNGWADALHPDDRARVAGLWKSACESRAPYESQGRIWHAPSQSYHHYVGRATPLFNADGSVREWVGALTDIHQQKVAEEALRESRARFDLVKDAAKVGFWFCDLPFDKLDWDHRVKEHFWLPPEADVTIDTFYEQLHPDDRERTRQAIADSNANSTHYDIEYRTVAKDGREKWIRAIGRTFYNEQEQPIHFDGVTLDITERKQAEEALLASEQRLRALYEALPVAVFVCDQDAVIQSYNPRAVELWACEPELGIDRHFDSTNLILSDGSVLPHDQSPLVEVLRTGVACRNVEVSIERPDGSRIPILANFCALRNAEGDITGVVTAFDDITERKRAQEHLAAAQQTFMELVERSPFGVYIVDSQFRISHMNASSQTGAFQNVRPAIGHDFADAMRILWPEDVASDVISKFRHTLDTGESFHSRNFVNPRADVPGVQAYEWELHRARLPDGQQAVICYYYDSTKLRESEAELRRISEDLARSSRAKDEFLAALSHELRTPLTPVLMSATALENDLALPLEAREQLAMMRRNIELEARLIDDLLDITRISRGKLTLAPAAVDVHQLLRHTAEIVRSDELGKRVHLALDLAAERRHTIADPARLQQVFWNLIKNAIKFTSAGGSITASTCNDSSAKLIVCVKDTGIGIAAGDLDRIFNTFEQIHHGQHHAGGLGLGLAISKAIVEMHGGTIHAESAGTGLGAKFCVTLATANMPVLVDHSQPSPPTPTRPLRLLVVEDHEATRTVLTRLLKRDGHHITCASTMREALDAAIDGTFDGLVSDLGLPDGSGFDLMREIQRLKPIAGIALSGYGMEEDVRMTREAGFFAHLVKPVNIDQLRQLLNQLADGI